MKIVVLDGHAANPGDISWEAFKKFGELTVYPRTAPEEVADRIKGAECVFTNKVPVTAQTMDKSPDLKWVGVLATGFNIVDIAHAKEKGIAVSNIPSYSTDTVAQNVFAHILNITNRVGDHSASISDGKWSRCPDFAFWDYPQQELAGLTMGIIGFGAIGKKVAQIAQAFGMKVLVDTPHPDFSLESEALSFAEREEVLRKSDFISLHCPLVDSTKNLINRDTLKMMKKNAVLINTGRGPLIDEAALAEALRDGAIAAAGLDVLCKEPPEADNPLFACENCFFSPHISWASKAARIRIHDIALKNLEAYVSGAPINVVNK